MQLVKGSYSHAAYEAAVVISRSPVYSATGVKSGYTERWSITGILQADTQAELTTALLALEDAYARDNDNLELRTAAGAQSAHKIVASRCQYVRSSPVSYPIGTGAQYTTFRHYEVTVEAMVAADENGNKPAPGSIEDLESYSESISYSGTGGPVNVFVPVVSGDWPEQEINSKSPVVIVQSGSAVGGTGKPTIPFPLFPDRIQNPTSDFRYSIDWPRTLKPVRGQYPVSWSYTFTFMGAAPQIVPIGPQ